MKNLKKVLALVVAFVMVFGTVAMAGSVYPDVADDANYAEAVKTLSALNIIKGDENGNFNPDATITRAEMAKILCTMVGTGDLAATASSFKDVAADHWASGYIAYAKGLGYIDGYDAETFGPEDPVTYEQVVKLVMAALGYTYKANENGGYPTGYLYVAADAEVTKGAVGGGSEPALRSTVAIIVNNAMNTPVMERTSYGTESVWEELDGTGSKMFKTLLTSKHGTYKVEGKVTNTSKNDTAIKEGYVDTYITKTLNIDVENKLGAVAETTTVATVAGPVLTKTGNYNLKNVKSEAADAAEYVGYASNIYYKEDAAGDIVVICVVPKNARNKSITIADVSQVYDSSKDSSVKPNDIPQVTGTKYIYSFWNDRDEDNRITTIDIDLGATIYTNNGKGVLASTLSIASANDVVNAFTPVRGEVTFVDTDNDGDYDLVKITKYEIAIVESVNPNTNKIVFKAERTMAKGNVSLNNDTHKNLAEYSITLDGAPIEVKDLAEYDVLNIVTNDWSDPTFFDITVTRSVVEGAVTQKSDVDEYVVIAGEKYEIADTLTELPELEDEGKFYLDSEGNIALAITKSVVNGNYAYLYKTGAGTFGEMYVRMFTKDGADVNYELAEKVKINKIYKDNINVAYSKYDINVMWDEDHYENIVYDASDADADKVAREAAIAADKAIAMKVKDLFVSASESALTPASLVDNLTAGVALEEKTISGDADVDKFITYKVDSNSKITEISLATAGTTIDEFGYAGKGTALEWKASLGKFAATAGTGITDVAKGIPENAVIFFVDPAKTIEDYSVKTVADLVDGNEYAPYYFTNTDEGPAAILIKSIDSNLGTTLATFVEANTGKVDYDTVYNVTYWENGAAVEAPMVVVENPTIAGFGYTAVTDLKKGDLFVYSKNQDGQVDEIKVIFSPAGELEKGNALAGNYMNKIDISDTDVAKDFKVYGTAGDIDSEVYFGAVGKVASTDKGIRLTLLKKDGLFDNGEVIIVPDTAVVTLYNSAMPESKVIAAGTKSDITASYFTKTANGDIDWSKTDKEEMRYAFVRVYKDVVTEVVFVQYVRD